MTMHPAALKYILLIVLVKLVLSQPILRSYDGIASAKVDPEVGVIVGQKGFTRVDGRFDLNAGFDHLHVLEKRSGRNNGRRTPDREESSSQSEADQTSTPVSQRHVQTLREAQRGYPLNSLEWDRIDTFIKSARTLLPKGYGGENFASIRSRADLVGQAVPVPSEQTGTYISGSLNVWKGPTSKSLPDPAQRTVTAWEFKTDDGKTERMPHSKFMSALRAHSRDVQIWKSLIETEGSWSDGEPIDVYRTVADGWKSATQVGVHHPPFHLLDE